MGGRRPTTDDFRGAMNRRTFLKVIGGGAAGGMLAGISGCRSLARGTGAGGLTTKRPLNFVIVLVDDLGWTDLGCFGSRYYETPNIDRLASQGMRFTNAYAACAVCSPTRAAVLTGRYPARTGVTDWIRARFQGGRIPEPGEELPEFVNADDGKDRLLRCPRNPWWMELDEITLAEALKPAAHISCHVGKWHLGMDPWYPGQQGFDVNIGGCDFGHPPSYFDPYRNENQGNIPTLKPRREGEYLTDREVDEAVQFIRANRDRPFLLYMAHYAVHTPLQGKESLVAKYEAKQKTNQANATYAAMVHSVDDAVGRITATLDKLGLADNTMIIFTSDNGGEVGPTDNAPLRSGKGFPYEGGIRVPAIVRWPGVVKPNSVCDVPITSTDFFPTILAAAGQKSPPDRAIDGENLMPLLTQSGMLQREAIYWHFPHYRRLWPAGIIVPYSIVRAGDWKLIKRYEGKAFELFNLKYDLGEQNDLSGQMADKVRELDAKLTAWLAATGAKLPKPNPDCQSKEPVN
ncbi:MAG TPA: sulfatase [Phycisphaerae bacterium]|nr:sulfatase [Phycisphaerae bacterium]